MAAAGPTLGADDAPPSDRPLVVDDLLCFVDNFRAHIGHSDMRRLLLGHFDAAAVAKSSAVLEQFLIEQGGAADDDASPPTAAIDRLLDMFRAAPDHQLPQFAATNLRALPLSLQPAAAVAVASAPAMSPSLSQILDELRGLGKMIKDSRLPSPSENSVARQLAVKCECSPNVEPKMGTVAASSPESPPMATVSAQDTCTIPKTVFAKQDNAEPVSKASKRKKAIPSKVSSSPPAKMSSPGAAAESTTSKWAESANATNALSMQFSWPYGVARNGLAPYRLPTNLVTENSPLQYMQAYWNAMTADSRLLSALSPANVSSAAFSPTPTKEQPDAAEQPNARPTSATSSGHDGDSDAAGALSALHDDSPTAASDAATLHEQMKLLEAEAISKPYACSHANCDKRFGNKFLLKKHEFIHTGERPHQCPFCPKRFNRKDNLLRHKKTHFAPQPGRVRRPTLVFADGEGAADVSPPL